MFKDQGVDCYDIVIYHSDDQIYISPIYLVFVHGSWLTIPKALKIF